MMAATTVGVKGSCSGLVGGHNGAARSRATACRGGRMALPAARAAAWTRSLGASAFVPEVRSWGSSGASRPCRSQARVMAGRIDTTEKWWEKNAAPNMRDIHSTSEFIDALANAGEKLVIVDFYAGWCGACKALYPKLCKLMVQHDDIIFLKVNFEENKPMCKSLGVKVLPFFHFYRGADGKLTSFSASISRFQRLRDAIAEHNTPRCSLGSPPEIPELAEAAARDAGGKEKEPTEV